MHRSNLLRAAAAFLAGAATSASAASLPLSARQDSQEWGGQLSWGADTCRGADGHQAYLTFAFCQKCALNTSGANVCDQVPMISSSDAPGDYGNNDAVNRYVQINTNFDKAATVDEFSFSTPMGFAKYVAGGDPNAVGGVVGTMQTRDGYMMTCTNVDSGNSANGFNMNVVVLQYSCGVMMECVGLQNPSVCP